MVKLKGDGRKTRKNKPHSQIGGSEGPTRQAIVNKFVEALEKLNEMDDIQKIDGVIVKDTNMKLMQYAEDIKTRMDNNYTDIDIDIIRRLINDINQKLGQPVSVGGDDGDGDGGGGDGDAI